MPENKISKNDKNLLNLHQYLIDIIKNPNIFNDVVDLNSLKSQGNLAKISNNDYDICPTSLNTLKRRSPALFSGGFEELETLRKQAYKSLLNIRHTNKIKKKDNTEELRCLEEENNNLKRSQILMTNLFLDNLTILEGIKNIESIEIIKKQLSDLSKKMKSYGLLDANLLPLTETSNVINLNRHKK